MGAEVTYARRVVVTGASSGIGKATTLLLRERGSEVVAVDVNEQGLADAAAAGAETVACDLTRAADRARLYERAGEIDGLVNAAGILRVVAVPDVTEEDWDATLAINVKALFFLARDFGMRMPAGGGIVNLSSVAGKNNASTEALAYGASKAAVLAITRGLAHYLGPRGVRVNAVLPGVVDTAMPQEMFAAAPEAIEHIAETSPMGRLARPDEVAEAAAWLCSDRSSFVNGHGLVVDGGIVVQ